MLIGAILARGGTMPQERAERSGAGKPITIAHTAIPKHEYQRLFSSLSQRGLRLNWIDGYDVRGGTYFNAIFHSHEGVPWKAYHGLTEQRLEESQEKNGQYLMAHLESYRDGDDIRYAVIYLHSSWSGWDSLLDAKWDAPWDFGGWTYYTDLSATEHQHRFDELTSLGFVPANVSVTAPSNRRRYSGLYWHRDDGGFELKSALTAQEYQRAYDRNTDAKRGLATLDAYTLDGKPRFSAAWTSAAWEPPAARHGLTRAQFEAENSELRTRGFRPSIITGYAVGSAHRFAALWRR
jgi:hypothetical protein